MLETENMECLKDKKTGTQLFYITAENLKAQYPGNDYVLAGEIEVNHLNEPGERKQLMGQDMNVHVQPLGTHKMTKYRVVGYLPCENEEYIVLTKKKFPYQWLLLLLMLLVLACSGWYFVNNNKQNDDKLVVDANAQDYQSQLKRPDNIDNTQILIPGYGKFAMEKGSDTIDTVLFNPENNPCYFQFTLVDKTTNEVLYESGLIPPGKGVSPVKLNKAFDNTGTYPAVLKFKTVDFEDTSITYNGSDIEVNIIVE